MFELIPINLKNKLREIRIIKAFLIFAFVLCLLILYIEYQKYAHINWKFVYITWANSNMRCDSFKSHMIINKLSKFL
ncbi:hypothetical protein [Acinetobacter baumannii]|uniref:hypothetical protein n=1 Tax=Acinetobacter baumannii TaxID=470 RepID=UPI00046DBF95|nr:hypothetical protein [Acinetobacter baumannii]